MPPFYDFSGQVIPGTSSGLTRLTSTLYFSLESSCVRDHAVFYLIWLIWKKKRCFREDEFTGCLQYSVLLSRVNPEKPEWPK